MVGSDSIVVKNEPDGTIRKWTLGIKGEPGVTSNKKVRALENF